MHTKKILSVLLSLAVIAGMLPYAAFAEEKKLSIDAENIELSNFYGSASGRIPNIVDGIYTGDNTVAIMSGGSAPVAITVSLDKKTKITRAALYCNHVGNAPDYTVETSDDNQNWTVQGTTSQTIEQDYKHDDLVKDMEAKYVRWTAVTACRVQITEVELYTDDSGSSSNTLAQPEQPVWNGNVLTWNAVSGAESYELQFYKDGEEHGEAVSGITATEYDAGAMLTSEGVYTATVTAKAEGKSSEPSEPSAGKTVGGSDSILLSAGKPVELDDAALWYTGVNYVTDGDYKTRLVARPIAGNVYNNWYSLDLGDAYQITSMLHYEDNASSMSAAEQGYGNYEYSVDGTEWKRLPSVIEKIEKTDITPASNGGTIYRLTISFSPIIARYIKLKSTAKVQTNELEIYGKALDESVKVKTPGTPIWEDSGTISWEASENAESYEVISYRNGNRVKSTVVTETQCDISDLLTEAGQYSFAVRGLAEGMVGSAETSKSEERTLYVSEGSLYHHFEFFNDDFASIPETNWELGESEVSGGKLHIKGKTIAAIDGRGFLPFGGKVTVAAKLEKGSAEKAEMAIFSDSESVITASLGEGGLALSAGSFVKTYAGGSSADLKFVLDTTAGTCSVFRDGALLESLSTIRANEISSLSFDAAGGVGYADDVQAFMEWDDVVSNIKNLLSFDMISDENPQQITKNLNFVSSPGEFIRMEWRSGHDAIGNDGTVGSSFENTPGTVEVTITNVVTMESTLKSFDVTVLENLTDSNMAPEAVIKSSARAAAGHDVTMMQDNDVSTYYQTAGTETDITITFTFAQKIPFSRIVLRERSDVLNTYKVEYSADGTTWKECYTGKEKDAFFDGVYAKGIRIKAAKKAQPLQLAEVRLYASPTNEQRVSHDAAQVVFEKYTVTESFLLPAAGKYGTAFTWTSNAPEVIRVGELGENGYPAVVTRDEEDQTVTLMMSANNGEASRQVKYSFCVKGTAQKSYVPSGASGSGKKSSGGSGSSVSVTALPEQTAPVDDAVSALKDYNAVPWSAEYILALEKRGILTGDENGYCKPDRFVTREQFVKMLVLSLGIDAADGEENGFEDVPSDSWYAKYVSAAKQHHLLRGISETQFGTGNYITRESLCVMIVRALELSGIDPQGKDAVGAFSDSTLISDYAADSVEALRSKGIISGDETGRFRPRDNISLAESAKILTEAILNGVR